MRPEMSNRGANAPASPIRKLVPYADEAKARGVKVYHLNIGQPDIETPPEMWKAARDIQSNVLAYGPANGLLKYREALVGYYARFGIELGVNDIIVTTAGSEAISFAYGTVTDAGDEVIVPEPMYANYIGFGALTETKIVPITSRIEDAFALPSVADFEAKMTPKTRAFMICNPGNPTGVIYTAKEIRDLAALAKERGIFLIADEVYREFCFEGEPPLSVLSVEGFEDYAIVVDSISKRFSSCGARIGCLVSRNKEVMSTALKFAQARLCPPTIGQIMATAAAKLGKSYMDGIVDEYRRRRDTVCECLSEIDGAYFHKPRGAFYVVVRLPVDDAEKFVTWMLSDFNYENETVMLSPAAGFYKTPGLGVDEARIAFVLNSDDIRRAMKILAAGLAEYPGKRV